MIFALITIVALTLKFVVMVPYVMIFLQKATPQIRRVFFETRWTWPLAVAWLDFIQPIMTSGSLSTWEWIVLAMGAYAWWGLYQVKDDDDRWKRRSKRAVEAIVRTANGLSVVPVGVR